LQTNPEFLLTVCLFPKEKKCFNQSRIVIIGLEITALHVITSSRLHLYSLLPSAVVVLSPQPKSVYTPPLSPNLSQKEEF